MYPQDEIDDRKQIEKEGLHEDNPSMKLCLQCIYCPVNTQNTQPYDGSWKCLSSKKWHWATDIWRPLCRHFTRKSCDNCKWKTSCKWLKEIEETGREKTFTFCVKGYCNRGIENPYHYVVGLAHLRKSVRVDDIVRHNQMKYQERSKLIRESAKEYPDEADLRESYKRGHSGTVADSPDRYDEALQSVIQQASVPDSDSGDSNT